MDFPHIVAMIDEDLEILKRVRRLLISAEQPAALSTASTPEQDENGSPGETRAPAISPDEPALLTDTEPVPDEHQRFRESGLARASHLRSIRTGRANLNGSKVNPQAEAGPLRSNVPAGPVFVPARATSKPLAGNPEAFALAGTDPSPLTAESLARQWLPREGA